MTFTKARSGLAAVLCFMLGSVAFYTAGFGQPAPGYYRGLMVLTAGAAVMLYHPLARPEQGRFLRLAWVVLDFALFTVLSVAIYSFIEISADLTSGILVLTPLQIWAGFAGTLVLLELTRRVFGIPIVILAILAFIFVLYGNYMPGFLHHRGFSVERATESLWYSFTGIFGLPTAVILDYVLVFVIFGAVLQGTGAGDRLLKIVFALTGWTRGGPAHAAVWSSCLFGTISGSVTANVVGTGTFTIPMIKRRGFPAPFAGAVEAVSSAGGQIMPPVMGAAAFLMAELTGVPYVKVALAALVPALFFYAGIFAAVVVEARKRGIEPTPVSERPVLTGSDWLHAIHFIGPIVVIVGVLVYGRSAAAAGFYATLCALALAVANPDFRKNPLKILPAIAAGGRAGAALMVSAGALGVIIGTMDISGLGIKFANLVLSVSEHNFLLALVLTMLACIVLGMGMPTLPAYLVIVLVMGPAIAKFGVPIIAVHLFVMYFGVLSNVTPPVAIAAYAASPIAGADPVSIGLQAVRLAIVGFIVPFMFVLEPSLLLVTEGFDLGSFVWICVRLCLALWMFTTGFARYESEKLPLYSAGLRLLLGFVLIFGGHWSEFVEPFAVALAATLIVTHRVGSRRRKNVAPDPASAAAE